MNTVSHQARLEKLLGFLGTDRNNLSLLFDASDLAMQLGDWTAARDLVNRILEINPDNRVARYRAAIILLQGGQDQESLAMSEALLQDGETDSAIRFAYAYALAKVGRFTEAETLLTALLPDAQSFREFPYLYIRTLHNLGLIDDAIGYALTYLDSHPEDGTVQGMLSLLYFDQDDFEQAAHWSAKALEHAPHSLDAIITAGSTALGYEDEEAAKAHFEKAVALHPANGRAWAGMGLVHMLDSDLNTAKRDFENAVKYMPSHLGSYNVLAWIQIMQRDYEGAKQTLEHCMQVDRTFSETHGSLAVIAAIQGHWDEAKRLADTAVKLQKDSFSGQYAKSLILAHKGQPEKAQAVVESMFTGLAVPGGGSLKDAMHRYAIKHQSK